MKQKDFVVIVAVAVFSAVLSIVLSNVLIAPPKDRQQKAEVVEKITNEFKPVDSKYFNDKSVDPTKLITIGGDGNTNPFNGPQ